MPTFESRDPSESAFWSERFKLDFTPWDRGSVPQQLQKFVAQSQRRYATLIPGCGTGYEVACLAEAGWDVTAIDFSEAAVEAARKVLGPLASRVRQADFFDFVPEHPVELIYERAFFCALPPRMRPDVVVRWAQLLPPAGLLAGYFFFGEEPKGPPFGIAREELDAMLTPAFECIADEAVPDSMPVFAGKERWQIWQRRPLEQGR
ncbi:MAG TPA: methyltransferase domain-containing protein [Noviherbaspirillum sp.]|nr:methyltransferase domain-containing protein [Noviherbaspirillum sp.]